MLHLDHAFQKLIVHYSTLNNAEDLDIVVPMYNLLEYSQNYSVKSGSLWNYYRDKIEDVDDNASNSKSFNHKTKIVGKTPQKPVWSGNEGDADPPPQPLVPASNVEVTIPLKYLTIFGDFLIYH